MIDPTEQYMNSFTGFIIDKLVKAPTSNYELFLPSPPPTEAKSALKSHFFTFFIFDS